MLPLPSCSSRFRHFPLLLCIILLLLHFYDLPSVSPQSLDIRWTFLDTSAPGSGIDQTVISVQPDYDHPTHPYPGTRVGTVMAMTSGDTFWLFGGQGRYGGPWGCLGDLWKYSIFTQRWEFILTGPDTTVQGEDQTSGRVEGMLIGVNGMFDFPGCRAYGSLSYIDVAGGASMVDENPIMLFFGGSGYMVGDDGPVESLSDSWIFNTTTLTWRYVSVFGVDPENCGVTGSPGSVAPATPYPCQHFAYWTLNGVFFYFCGVEMESNEVVFALDLSAELWSVIDYSGSAQTPPSSCGVGATTWVSNYTSLGVAQGGGTLWACCRDGTETNAVSVWEFDPYASPFPSWYLRFDGTGKTTSAQYAPEWSVPNQHPGNRDFGGGLGLALSGDSVACDTAVLFAGYESVGSDIFADVWLYSMRDNTWTFHWTTVDPGDTKGAMVSSGVYTGDFQYPLRRRFHGAASFPGSGMMFIFGGNRDDFQITTSNADLWKLEISSSLVGQATCNPSDLIDDCVCNDDYVGKQCAVLECTPGKAFCVCEPGYTGPVCSTPICFGFPANNGSECSDGRGTCVSFDRCDCPATWGGPECEFPLCNSTLANETTVCKQHGDCSRPDRCVCWDSSEWSGWDCHIPVCGGVPANSTATCNYRGTCIAPDSCVSCDPPEWFGNLCQHTTCFGVETTDVDGVCSGHGTCIFPDQCDCHPDWDLDQNCDVTYCFGTRSDVATVCNSNGDCLDLDVCECFDGWGGDHCLTKTLGTSGSIALGVVLPLLFIALLAVVAAVVVIAIWVWRKKKMAAENSEVPVEMDADPSFAKLVLREDLFSIPHESVDLVAVIGEGGGDAVVYKAKYLGRDVAFKIFKFQQADVVAIERELGLMLSLRHPQILEVYGASLSPPRLGCVMELCENGDLAAYILCKKTPLLKFPDKIRILEEIGSGMQYLHSKNVIHRDLKGQNVLLDSVRSAKICDFGLSRVVEESSSLTIRIGTRNYMAPELILGTSKYTNKVDVYAFGILMFEVLLENFTPYRDMSAHEAVEFKVAHDPEFRPHWDAGTFAPHLEELMKKCWAADASERPSFDRILKMLYGKNDTEVRGTEDQTDTPKK